MPDEHKDPKQQDKGNAIALLLVIASIILGFTTSVLANAVYRAVDILENDAGDVTFWVTFSIFLFLGLSIIFIGKLALANLRGEKVPMRRLLLRKWKRDLVLIFVVFIFSIFLSLLLSFPIWYERTFRPMLEAAQ